LLFAELELALLWTPIVISMSVYCSYVVVHLLIWLSWCFDDKLCLFDFLRTKLVSRVYCASRRRCGWRRWPTSRG